jgi:hypothetical protein
MYCLFRNIIRRLSLTTTHYYVSCKFRLGSTHSQFGSILPTVVTGPIDDAHQYGRVGRSQRLAAVFSILHELSKTAMFRNFVRIGTRVLCVGVKVCGQVVLLLTMRSLLMEEEDEYVCTGG